MIRNGGHVIDPKFSKREIKLMAQFMILLALFVLVTSVWLWFLIWIGLQIPVPSL